MDPNQVPAPKTEELNEDASAQACSDTTLAGEEDGCTVTVTKPKGGLAGKVSPGQEL